MRKLKNRNKTEIVSNITEIGYYLSKKPKRKNKRPKTGNRS